MQEMKEGMRRPGACKLELCVVKGLAERNGLASELVEAPRHQHPGFQILKVEARKDLVDNDVVKVG